MEETKVQQGIRHGKSGTIAAFILGFAGQFFGAENPLDQLDRIEYNQQVIMQGAGIQANPLPDDTSMDEVLDAIDTMRKIKPERPANPGASF